MREYSTPAFAQAYRNPNEKTNSTAVADCVNGILEVAAKHLQQDLRTLRVLDVGCGTGDYAIEIESRVQSVVAVEPDSVAIKTAKNKCSHLSSNVRLIHGLIENVDIAGPFDLAISLTTVEHMPDAKASYQKILELLRPGGIIYLTAPNKLWPLECHYHLPLLSWLPLPLANRYLKVMGRGESYEDCSYMRTYWGMKKLFSSLDCSFEFVVPDEANSYVGVGDTRRINSFIRTAGIRLIRRFPIFWTISKGFIMVIRKD